MSFKSTEAALASSAGRARDRAVLLILAHRANEAGVCWPSVESIALDAGWSERSVQLALSSLRKAGHIAVKSEAGAGHRTRTYTVHPRPCPERAAKKQNRTGQDGGWGAADAPVAEDRCQPCTTQVQPLHPTGAGDAPHGRNGCTQTIREKEENEKPNHQREGGVVVSSPSPQRGKKESAGPPTLAEMLDFCFRERIPGDAGKACFKEWQECDWCIDGERIRSWQALLLSRRDRKTLPGDDEDTPSHRREPKGDWQALYRETYGLAPVRPWSYLLDKDQKQIHALHKKKKARDSWPAKEEHLLEFARLNFPNHPLLDIPLESWRYDTLEHICISYRKLVLGKPRGQAGPDDRDLNAQVLRDDWPAVIAAKCTVEKEPAASPAEITAEVARLRAEYTGQTQPQPATGADSPPVAELVKLLRARNPNFTGSLDDVPRSILREAKKEWRELHPDQGIQNESPTRGEPDAAGRNGESLHP